MKPEAPSPQPRSRVFARAAASALILALARAVLVGARYEAPLGEWSALGNQSAARHLLSGLVVCLPAGLAVGGAAWLMFSRRPSNVGRGVFFFVATVAAFLFASGRLPELPLITPALVTGRGVAANVAAGLVALCAAWILTSRTRVPGVPAMATGTVLVAGFASCLLLNKGEGASWPARPNVILISVDTLRADHLGCYGYGEPTSPNIDGFAEDALRLTRAYSQQTWTLTSHMTMLTAMHPMVHGVSQTTTLAPGIPTLASLLHDQGYATMAVVDSCVWLEPEYGFDRGFEIYRRVGQSAPVKVEQILELVDEVGEGPFFLFAHFFDVHSDTGVRQYESDSADHELLASSYQGSFDGCDEQGRCGSNFLLALNEEGRTLPEEQVRYLIGEYDAGIRSLDRALGRLFQALEKRGLLESSVIVLTADHGEEFFDHGYALHKQSFEETLRVPLLLRTPDSTGRASDALVGLLDLMPTLLDLCGQAPPEVQGRSFAALLGAETVEQPREYLCNGSRDAVKGLQTKGWALVKADDRWHLFDRRADHALKQDLSQEESFADQMAALLKIVAREEQQMTLLRRSLAADAGVNVLDEEERAQLRALGYGDVGG